MGLVAEHSLSTVLDVVVTISPGRTGHVDRGEQPAPQLRLQNVTAPGLTVTLTGRTAPLLLDYVGRFASRTERVLSLAAEVVRAQAGLAVVRALDDLVRRSCR